MSHISDYREALARIKTDPLKLTSRDFAALQEHGGAQDVARADDAIRHAQVQLVTKAIAEEQAANKNNISNQPHTLVTKAVSRDGGSAIAGQPPLLTKSIDRSNVPPVSWVLDFAVLTTKQERQVDEAVSSARYWYRENVKQVARDMLADGQDEAFVADTVTALLTTFATKHLEGVRKTVTDQVLLAGTVSFR